LISNMYLQVTFLVKYVTFGYILGINLWEVWVHLWRKFDFV
jgi:hypothetical protein